MNVEQKFNLQYCIIEYYRKPKQLQNIPPPPFPLLPSTTAVTYRSYLREQLEFNNNSSIGKHPSIAKLFSTGCCS